MKGRRATRKATSRPAVQSSPSAQIARTRPAQGAGEPRTLLGLLGVELWRLESRAKRIESPTAMDSYERLVEIFTRMGGRIEDRTGERFVDGQLAEILHQPSPIDGASLVIGETVRPAVFADGECVMIPQLILASEV